MNIKLLTTKSATMREGMLRFARELQGALQEVVIVSSFFILLLTLLNPFGLELPEPVALLIMAAAMLVFSVWVAFVWHQESEPYMARSHSFFAHKGAYIGAATLLLVGVVVESFSLSVNPWPVWALSMLVAGKVLVEAWSRSRGV